MVSTTLSCTPKLWNYTCISNRACLELVDLKMGAMCSKCIAETTNPVLTATAAAEIAAEAKAAEEGATKISETAQEEATKAEAAEEKAAKFTLVFMIK